jgi:uncharacterized protein (DUF433 family)
MPGRGADTLHGAWRIKGHRVPVQAIIDNVDAGATPEEIAGPDFFPDLDLDAVRRILAFAAPGGTTMTAAMADPETIYLDPPFCDRCKDCDDERLWWAEEKDAACPENYCAAKPVAYIRADLFDAQVKRMEENAFDYIDETGLRIATLTDLLQKARDELDAFGHAELIDEINEALGEGASKA